MKKTIILLIVAHIGIALSENTLNNDNDIVGNRISLLNTIQREADLAIWNKNSLTPEQMQLLLNFSCIAFTIVNAEHKLQEEATFILNMSWYFRYDQESFINNSEHLLTVERSFERFRNLLKAKHTLKQAYGQIEQCINQPENNALADVAQTMAHHATQLVKHFSLAQGSSIKQALTDSMEQLKEAHSMLQMGSGKYQALIEDAYPFEHPYDKELQTMEIAQALAESTIAQQAKQVLQTTEYITNETKQIQGFGALVFYIYYKATYEGMLERTVDENYFSMFFEDNCLISGNSKTHALKEPMVDSNIPLFTR